MPCIGERASFCGWGPSPHTYKADYIVRETRRGSHKVEPTDVRLVPLGWNTASHPKCVLPLAGTIVPSVFPSNKTGSIPGPGQYAKVQTAVAPRVLNPSSRRFKPSCGLWANKPSQNAGSFCGHLEPHPIPSWPILAIKSLIYGPGRPLSA